MNAITLTLRALHHGERQLARELNVVAERHSTEHEVRHVATDLVTWSNEHCVRLAETADHYGLMLDDPAPKPIPGFVSALRGMSAEAMGRRPEPGLLLLHDLRELHLGAAENSLYWEMLAQAGQAAKDTRLLNLATSCHPQTLRQMHWTNTMIKNLAPQILTSL
ncbi:hypothetical protein YW3DRAFT_07394 [Streptomyces sp. MnatMP-M77]|uniref:hypothetical protein n=1 Tax=unclassified Streptomyces TaxID=2593676 RepID=UPI0008047A97|nr:hypothetical protein [Streptomyces sp. MnatMP-M77]MYT83030.1 hypothetical protein [Streptomyces sp. SID8364]SBV06916.1 hypothetical protein YW3DRAFT_07394 [Streptomyces sp. MnatMP-M77]